MLDFLANTIITFLGLELSLLLLSILCLTIVILIFRLWKLTKRALGFRKKRNELYSQLLEERKKTVTNTEK